MSHNFSLKYYKGRTLVLLLILSFGFISSKALISIATGLLLVNLLTSYKEHKFNFVKKSNLAILSASLFFIAFFLLFPFAENYKNALYQIWLKLPWLIIPLSIAAIKEIETNYVDFLVAALIFLVTISGAVVLINYYTNYTYYTEQIAFAKHIPTPINHIRYSLMAAFSGIASLYYFIKNNTRVSKFDRIFFGISTIFLFALLHIISVRSGVVVYYAALIYLMVYFSIQYKKWWLIPLGLIFMATVPYLAYHNIKSFHNKIDYMMYDLEQMQKTDIGHNSDSRRMQSLQVGWALIKEKPLIGYGLGSIEQTTANYYETELAEVKEQNRKVPHNQFMFTSLEMGLFGLFFLLAAIAIPIVQSSLFRNPLYISFAIIFLLSCLVENTFESQLGTSIYLVFGSILLKRSENE
jgi:O-antigen ligase